MGTTYKIFKSLKGIETIKRFPFLVVEGGFYVPIKGLKPVLDIAVAPRSP